MTRKELAFLRRVRRDAVWHPPIRIVEHMIRLGWPIQVERPLHEPAIAYILNRPQFEEMFLSLAAKRVTDVH